MVDKNKPDWIAGIQVFSEISTWIVVPMILALIFGKKLDTNYNTKPTLFLICIILAFLFSAYGIIRTVKRYKNKIEKNIQK